MKLSQKDLKELGRETERAMRDAISNPTTALKHPFYQDFWRMVSAIGTVNQNDIEGLWTDLLKAYNAQGVLVAEAERNEEITTIGDYLTAINKNQGFIDWVARFCKLCEGALEVPPDKRMALWSGGYSVSETAQKLGFCTLETTKLGNILNTLKVTPDWPQEEALWNILSEHFVDQYKKTDQNVHDAVHIYFRNVDELCVLFQQELPALKVKNPGVKVIWHPLAYNGTQLCEVGYLSSENKAICINLDATNSMFSCLSSEVDSFKLPFWALGDEVHTLSHRANMVTLQKYRSKDFHPDPAPFATEKEASVGRGVNDNRMRFWNE